MKRIRTLSLFLFLITVAAWSQSAADTTAAKTAKKRTAVTDADGDGVTDRSMQRKRDRFIDRNGDGICDGREQGLGFRRSGGGSAPKNTSHTRGRQ